nr:hypothetical protein [Pedobacter cryoconitis]
MAQTEKGKILLGGYANFNTYRGGSITDRNTYLGINPTVGIFVTDNLVIGTGLGYVHSAYTQNLVDGGSVRRKAYAVSVSPFGRYYVGITPQLKFFGQLEAALNWRNIKGSETMGEKDLKSNFYSATLSPGFALFPSKKIGIELSITGFQYAKQHLKTDEASLTDFRSFSFGSDFFNPRLGIQFYL